jgi:hypothetical protein
LIRIQIASSVTHETSVAVTLVCFQRIDRSPIRCTRHVDRVASRVVDLDAFWNAIREGSTLRTPCERQLQQLLAMGRLLRLVE